MNVTQTLIRESKGRQVFSFFIFIFLGIISIFIISVLPEVFGVRVEWFVIVMVYIGIYKPPFAAISLTIILGLLLDNLTGAPFGEGFFTAIFSMNATRIISRVIYADRPVTRFFTLMIVLSGLHLCFAIIIISLGLNISSVRTFLISALPSILITAVIGVPILGFIKKIDPERGGYYLARFMREERTQSLV